MLPYGKYSPLEALGGFPIAMYTSSTPDEMVSMIEEQEKLEEDENYFDKFSPSNIARCAFTEP